MSLSIFKPDRPAALEEESSSSSENEASGRVLPPGTPYLTKVNGKLVWARQKTPKVAIVVQDLIVEPSLTGTTIVHKRTKSVERLAPKPRMVIDNGCVPVVRPQHVFAQSMPIVQSQFPVAPPLPMIGQYPAQFYTPYQPYQPYQSYQAYPAFRPFQGQVIQQRVPEPPHIYLPQQTQQPQQPQTPPPPPLFVQPSPTKKDFDLLKAADAHFKGFDKPQTSRIESFSSEGSEEKGTGQAKPQEKPQEKSPEKPAPPVIEKTTLKVTIAATKHVCGNCGKVRSSKYHFLNPLKPGEIPSPAFCRKCQRDASSTSESDTAKEARKKAKKKAKKSTKSKGKPAAAVSIHESSSDAAALSPSKKPNVTLDKSSHAIKPQENQDQQNGKRVPSSEYIYVEEASDQGLEDRGRTHDRIPVEPMAPLDGQLSHRSQSHSNTRQIPYDHQRDLIRPVKIREIVKETVQHRSPSVQYRYVKVVPEPDVVELKEKPYPRKIPILFEDEVVHAKPASPPRLYREPEKLHQKDTSYKSYSVEEPEISQYGHPSSHHGFELREVSTQGPSKSRQSFGFQEASRRGPMSGHNGFEAHASVPRGPPSSHQSFDVRGVSDRSSPSRGRSFEADEVFMPGISRDSSFKPRNTSVRGHRSRDTSLASELRYTRGFVREEQGNSDRRPPAREYSFGEPEPVSSTRSTEARQRRRRDRAPADLFGTHPWEKPHIIYPKDKNEVIVVTEKYEYRRRKDAEDEEARLGQECVDRATLDPRQNNQFSPEQASKYYHEDWLKPMPDHSVVPSIVQGPYREFQSERHSDSATTESIERSPVGVPSMVNKPYQEGYRSGKKHVSEYSESEQSYRQAHHDPPRASSPQSAGTNAYLKVHGWQDNLPYPLTPDERVVHMPKVSIPAGSRQSKSKPRPAFLRSETEEMALVISPKHPGYFEQRNDRHGGHMDSNFTEMRGTSGQNDRNDGYQDSSSTEMRRSGRDNQVTVPNLTETEMQADSEAEAEARHVRFRDTPSVRSAYNSWVSSEIKGQTSRRDYEIDRSEWVDSTGEWVEIAKDDPRLDSDNSG